MKTEEVPVLMSMQDAAVLLAVHVDMIRKLVRENRIASVRIGRSIRVKRAQIQHIAEEGI